MFTRGKRRGGGEGGVLDGEEISEISDQYEIYITTLE